MKRDRSTTVARAGRGSAALDLICCTAVDRRLAVLTTVGPGARGRGLPWTPLDPRGALDVTVLRWTRKLLGRAPSWMTQLGAFSAGGRHPSGAALTVAYLAVVPVGTEAPDGLTWSPATEPPPLPPGRQWILDAAIAGLRDRMDIAPVAFRMLPATFTLSDLQQVYELLLGRRLHKASFRRALQAAFLVEPTDSWRSEGRGRPAQLYRYAPRKRRGVRRSVRFELLG
ncbi:MAG: hypothetical protein OEW77_00480 [Gemmatimonadota bacterium]|nr:hypothetical protein [Gemmatimonadota bacterium]